jgi:hypothetical protein
MNLGFKIPPKSVINLTKPEILVKYLSVLVGSSFVLTGKTRTDGSNIRKLVTAVLEKHSLSEIAELGQFEIIPPKSKGIPKITYEFIDTYIVTSGQSYNLQVWNRIPAAETLLVKYESGESLKCNDVRFVFVKINVETNVIASITILTPEYIEQKFGKFGKPTIKQQLLISSKVRKGIYGQANKVLFFPDTNSVLNYATNEYKAPKSRIFDAPQFGQLFSMDLLQKLVAEKLIGRKLRAEATKNKGQALERIVIELLGYKVDSTDQLYGLFPDIRNQALEVKVQDSPTVDLGKFSPYEKEIVIEELGITTFDIRYLIALTNPETEIVEGVILSPGEKLGDLFSYVSSENFKCQRAIPMSFFEKNNGKSIFNPE